jgi:hypothetical protein
MQQGPNGMLVREIANSLSYYREKLAGEAVSKIFVRTVVTPFDEIAGKLAGLGVQDVAALDPQHGVELGEGVSLDSETAQRLAPAIGAALGRSH